MVLNIRRKIFEKKIREINEHNEQYNKAISCALINNSSNITKRCQDDQTETVTTTLGINSLSDLVSQFSYLLILKTCFEYFENL